MSTNETEAFLEAQSQHRGYTLEMHRIMAEADLAWAKKYGEFIEATYTGQRTLDRKTKELLQIVVEAALKADVEQIQAHVRVALQEGATPTENPGGSSGGYCPHGRPGLSPRSASLGAGDRLPAKRIVRVLVWGRWRRQSQSHRPVSSAATRRL